LRNDDVYDRCRISPGLSVATYISARPGLVFGSRSDEACPLLALDLDRAEPVDQWEHAMPLILDRHDMKGTSATEVAEAHLKDLSTRTATGSSS
jgi:hypothetical protein